MIYIDKFAYINKLSKAHPAEKTLFALITLGITLTAKSILLYSLVFLIVSALLVFYADIPGKFYFRLLLVPTYFVAVAIIPIIVTHISETENVLFKFPFNNYEVGVTAENLHVGVSIFMRTLSAVSCMYFLTLTVPLTDLLYLLRRIKFPGLFLELIALVYRYIFLLLETMDKIHTSQVARLSNRNFCARFRAILKVSAALFVISMKRYEDIYNAMEARLYSGKMVYLSKPYSFSPVNLGGIIIIDAILLLMSLALRENFSGIP